jgi:hypothetical protein
MQGLILCDIDGCLGSEDTAPLDVGALSHIAAWNVRARTKGDVPLLTLCTGRPQPYAEAISRVVGNVSVPIVCEMGVWLYDPRDNSYAMDEAITSEHLQAIGDCQKFVRSQLATRGIVMQPGKVASISLWHRDTSVLMAMRDELAQRVQREGWPLRVSSTVAWINLDLQHVSKGTGIDRLLTQRAREGNAIARESLFGIGDTMGDLCIRERVHWFGVPINAQDQLRPHADAIATTPHAAGVVELLGLIEARVQDSTRSPETQRR